MGDERKKQIRADAYQLGGGILGEKK